MEKAQEKRRKSHYPNAGKPEYHSILLIGVATKLRAGHLDKGNQKRHLSLERRYEET
jgi:hypothetical protein